MPAKVLIIEDEDLLREDLALILQRKGYICATAPDGETGLKRIPEFRPDIILSDIVMPGRSGIEILEDIFRLRPECSVVIMTAFGTMESAIEAFRSGATDYIMKPLVTEDLLNKLQRIVEHIRITKEVKTLRRRVAAQPEAPTLVGDSGVIREVLDLVQKVAPMGSTVLIMGESGTGKELVARGIHDCSERSGEPFVAINCSAFQETLLESELFGHVKGAFTGAVKEKAGFFQAAGSGSIFLDEISEMSQGLQAKLLRVLEQKEFYPVGGTVVQPLLARIIAATNKDEKALMAGGGLREDLYYRLAVFEIRMPPLRERRTDIPLLAEHFLRIVNHEMNRKFTGIEASAMRALMSYEWPGNVRELRNVIERAAILCDGEQITLQGLPIQITGGEPDSSKTGNLRGAVRDYESAYIRRTLTECDWNKEEAARRLGVNPSTLYRKMSDFGILDPTARKS